MVVTPKKIEVVNLEITREMASINHPGYMCLSFLGIAICNVIILILQYIYI